MEIFDRLAKQWDDAGVARNVGASVKTITAFELRHHISLPVDVRRFYSRFNGTLETDTAFIAFWPLEEIDTVPEKLADYAGIPDYSKITDSLPDADDYFVFADHSIWVNVYAIRLKGKHSAKAPVLWIADGCTFATMSESFSDFWLRYMDDPDSVIAP